MKSKLGAFMKELIFVRHAKSEWGTEFLRDIDRPLAERGYRDAYTMGEWYRLHKTAPELMMSSTATRALNTALIFQRCLAKGEVKLEAGIYEAPAERLMAIVRQFPDNADRIMVFGHNPGFTNVCNALAEGLYFDNVPTCGIVSFEFNGKWRDVHERKCKLNYYQFPKDFRSRE